MQDTDIIKVGTQTESRDGMFLRACEISEKHKKQVKYQKCTAEAMIVTCIEKSCEFLLQASFKSREEVWECKKIQSHTCLENQSQGGKNGKQKRMTAYSADQLLPVVLDIVGVDKNVSIPILREQVKKYTNTAVSDAMIRRLKSKAQEAVLGDPTQSTANLPALRQAMLDSGHNLEIVTVRKETLAEMLVANQRVRHETNQRKKPRKDRERFDPDAAKELVEQKMSNKTRFPEDGKYVVGLVLLPSSAQNPEHRLPVCQADAAHFKHKDGGIILSAYSSDANHHAVLLGQMLTFLNEGFIAWNIFFAYMHKFGGIVDKVICERWLPALIVDERASSPNELLSLFFQVQDDVRVIMDGDKGCVKGFKENFKNAKEFFCSKHRGDNMAKKAKTDKRLYLEAVDAHTTAKIEEAKLQMSEKARKKVGEVADERQFKLNSGTFGISKSNTVESMNNRLISARRMHKSGMHSVCFVLELPDLKCDVLTAPF